MTFVSTDSQNADSIVWLTPLKFINSLGSFDLDPCGHKGHNTASKIIHPPDNGLLYDWNGRVWLNPPYGKEAKVWLEKLSKHGDGIALLFARLEAAWMRPYLKSGFFLLHKRISFISDRKGYKGNAGSASILIPFGRKNIGMIFLSELEGVWLQ